MPTALAQLGRAAAPVPLADAVALSGFLDLVPDPRGVRGRRYRLSALVAAAAASVLAGARSLTAITEWIGDVPAWSCRVLGFPTDPLSGTVSVPHPAPSARPARRRRPGPGDRRLPHRPRHPGRPRTAGDRRRRQALRGSRTHVTGHVTLLAAMDHTGHVLAQRQVTDKSNEIPAFRPLLDSVDLTGTVITADALHTQHAHG
ncbi:transposase family protein, partial [Streptomyces griseocarneus]